MQHAKGEVVFFLDDDVVPASDWLHSLLAAFDSPQVAAATGWVRHEGRGYYPESRYNSPLATSDWELTNQEPRWFERAMSSDAGYGCNMAFRREFLLQQRFPEDLGAGSAIGAADEHFMFLKTLTSGFALAHRASAAVVHRYGESEAERRRRVLQLIRSAAAFRMKLLLEYPGIRRKVLASTLRRTRDVTSDEPRWTVPLSRASVLKALLSGITLYVRQRLFR